MSFETLLFSFTLILCIYAICLAIHTLYELSHPDFRLKDLIPKISFPKKKRISIHDRDPIFEMLRNNIEQESTKLPEEQNETLPLTRPIQSRYGWLKPTRKGKEMIDEHGTVRTCYDCGKLITISNGGGKIILSPLEGMLLMCNDCINIDQERNPDRYEN